MKVEGLSKKKKTKILVLSQQVFFLQQCVLLMCVFSFSSLPFFLLVAVVSVVHRHRQVLTPSGKKFLRDETLALVCCSTGNAVDFHKQTPSFLISFLARSVIFPACSVVVPTENNRVLLVYSCCLR